MKVNSLTNDLILSPTDLSKDLEIIKQTPENQEVVVTDKFVEKPNTKFIDDLKTEKINQDNIKDALTLFDKEDALTTKFSIENENLKKIQSLNEMKKKVSSSNGTVNKNVVNLLTANGISIDKIDLNMLSKAMIEADSLEKKTVSDELVKNIVNESNNVFNTTDNMAKETIVKNLLVNNAEINKNNITALESLLEKMKTLENLELGSILDLIKNETELNFNNIYKSNFSNSELINSTKFVLTDELKNLLHRENITLNEENKQIVKLFYDNNVLISSANIAKFKLLNNIKSTEERVLEEAIKNINSGNSIFDILIFKDSDTNNLEQIYKDAKAKLQTISDGDIKDLINNQRPININNLVNKNQLGESIYNDSMSNIKQQIFEINNKLTYDAINRLSNNNININFMPLKNAINTLNNNNINLKTSLSLMGNQISNKNVSMIENTVNKIPYKTVLDSRIYTDLINNKNLTISEVSKKQSYLNRLDSFTTRPDLKYGDNFKNVESQINQKLLDMGLTDSESNIIAYKILSRNQIDITQDNLKKIKLLNQKLDYVADNLHPAVASSIIKNGLDPAKLHFDELKKYIDQFNEKYGKPKNTIEEALINTNENRDELIKLYRGIKQVQKNDNIAIGLALKRNINLTFEDIKNANKYFDEMKRETRLDTLEEPLKTTININNYMINNLENTEPETLNQVLSKEPLTTIDVNLDKKDSINLQTLNIQSLNPYVVTFASTIGVSNNLRDIQQAQEYLYDDKKLATSINDIVRIEEDILSTIMNPNLEQLKQGNENILRQTYESINKVKLTKDNIEKVKQAKNYIDLQEKLNRAGFLSYPITINDDIEKLNIHLLSDDLNAKKEINAHMSLSRDKSENIDVYITISGDDVSLVISIKDDAFLNLLEEDKYKLVDQLKDNNLYVKNIEIKRVVNS